MWQRSISFVQYNWEEAVKAKIYIILCHFLRWFTTSYNWLQISEKLSSHTNQRKSFSQDFSWNVQMQSNFQMTKEWEDAARHASVDSTLEECWGPQ